MSAMGFDLADERWADFHGGYRVRYDPRPALRSLEIDDKRDRAWSELWQELHHQGDVGEASFASVPHIVEIEERRRVPDWNAYALVSTIELARDNSRNPEIPTYLRDAYDDAWTCLTELGLRHLNDAKDPPLIDSIIGVLAIGKGLRTLGRLAADFSEDERLELLKAACWGQE
jgi:hypothetical protein